MPIRFVDCRLAPDSWAETNFYGYWAQAKDKLHDGKISLNFDEDFGNLKVYYGVFDYTKTKDKQNRVVSSGIHFIYNGQSHGLLPSEFISKKNMLNFPFLKDRLRIDVEFNEISANYRTKIFSSSRDRIIKSDEYHEIRKIVINSLREKEHLKDLNAYYQSKIDDENTGEQNAYFDKFLQKSKHIADFLSGK